MLDLTPGFSFYNRDNLGSVRDAQLLNTNTAWSDGTHSSSADYDAYGQGSGNGLSFQYAGMFLHQTSGLYLTHYRAYDPKRARWVSRDPIAEEGGGNLYAYVGGKPVGFIDPLGLSSRDVENIYNQFEQTVTRMTKNKERTDDWIINNALPGHLICSDQAAEVLMDLDSNLGTTDDKWKFYLQDNFKTKSWWQPGHIWVEGQSSNPSDPHLKLDPWHHGFTKDYCGCGK